MENYEWVKNKAVVDRMYYTERTLQTSALFLGLYNMMNVSMLRNGFFANTVRARIAPSIGYFVVFNVVIAGILLRPLTKEEIQVQWKKRLTMGKYLYTLYHLDPIEAKAE
mmetsp:Transcript_11197/g.18825  ORF Transcript_11197/g.18825 Transcript_11197/m.18825 type:complete len:110 (-) Transcript_11197:77-406(-)|eukprot:CAMPEP_0168607392 /NCGR_PEP_ID=MMETSP0449_2-20121227/13_1 /TAXON_ID=1082188 /ORGANISM="Strombidium rassoulzadegani, Strain ras09" /LENGTH=109 /DNA_ID=CAMNT_0008647195 /DNA_START=10 /DNA_END=339 /DNA_ORIENTATION=-